jgi:hypothetical protein
LTSLPTGQAAPRGAGGHKPLGSAARKACLMLVLVGAFLTFGVPRWLAGDVAPAGSPADTSFSKLCRDHGGTPRTTPDAGASTEAQRFCTVRYGRHVYRMDAITPDGFDEDTARFQRQGCEEAGLAERASTAPGHRQRSFIYHPTTGVCEHKR